MSSLPSQHPTISLHLTDVTLTPLITSSSSQSHLESLTTLATSAISSQSAAQRANLGRPQRIMVEYPDRGPVVLQSYLDPRDLSPRHEQQSRLAGPASQAHASSSSSVVGDMRDLQLDETEQSRAGEGSGRRVEGGEDASIRPEDAAPSLIGVVVAGTADEAREARRAAARLERVGKDFQREWAAESTDKGGVDEGS